MKDFFISIVSLPFKLLLLIFLTGLVIIIIVIRPIRLLFRKFRRHSNSIPDESLERVWSSDTVGCAEEDVVSVAKDIARKIFRSYILVDYFDWCTKVISRGL